MENQIEKTENNKLMVTKMFGDRESAERAYLQNGSKSIILLKIRDRYNTKLKPLAPRCQWFDKF